MSEVGLTGLTFPSVQATVGTLYQVMVGDCGSTDRTLPMLVKIPNAALWGRRTGAAWEDTPVASTTGWAPVALITWSWLTSMRRSAKIFRLTAPTELNVWYEAR
jgi:hypothetical protein